MLSVSTLERRDGRVLRREFAKVGRKGGGEGGHPEYAAQHFNITDFWHYILSEHSTVSDPRALWHSSFCIMKQNSHHVPGLPIFAGNVVDSSSGPIKRIRRVVKRTVHSSAGAVSARVDGGADAEADSSSLRNCNPLVRLSESVLPWKVLAEVGTQRMTKSQPGTSGLEPLPILYKSVEEYVRRWEAAVVSELKASIVSNISAQTFEPGRMIEISNIKSSDPPQSSLIKLSYRLVRSQQERYLSDNAVEDLHLLF